MSVPGATHAERRQQKDHEQGRVFSSNNKETIQWGLMGSAGLPHRMVTFG